MDTKDFDIKDLKFNEIIENYKIKNKTEEKTTEQKETFKPFEKEEESKGSENKKNSLPKLLVLLGLSIGLMTLIIGPKLLKKETPVVEPEPSPIVAAEPSPSPDPTFYPHLYTIQVLNGTKQGGVATETKELLEKNGYKDIEIDNAKGRDYELTEIHTDDDPDLIEHISNIIREDYKIASEPTRDSLSEDFDATIILGIKN
jgi:hypothetical protein